MGKGGRTGDGVLTESSLNIGAAAVAAHAALTTGVHGAGASTLATTGNIATHETTRTGIHSLLAMGLLQYSGGSFTWVWNSGFVDVGSAGAPAHVDTGSWTVVVPQNTANAWAVCQAQLVGHHARCDGVTGVVGSTTIAIKIRTNDGRGVSVDSGTHAGTIDGDMVAVDPEYVFIAVFGW